MIIIFKNTFCFDQVDLVVQPFEGMCGFISTAICIIFEDEFLFRIKTQYTQLFKLRVTDVFLLNRMVEEIEIGNISLGLFGQIGLDF
ncbi:hypothetical protein D3C71_1648300 [compost metagenome]